MQMLEYMFVQDVVENKQTTLAHVNTKSNETEVMTKCHTYEAHMTSCAMLGSEPSAVEATAKLA